MINRERIVRPCWHFVAAAAAAASALSGEDGLIKGASSRECVCVCGRHCDMLTTEHALTHSPETVECRIHSHYTIHARLAHTSHHFDE